MGKMSRDKGATYEREVCSQLRMIFPESCRNLEQTRTADGRDIDGTKPLCIQCKRRDKVSMSTLRSGLEEAILSADDAHPFPCVITRSDGDISLITFRLGDFIDMWFDVTHWEV